MASGTERGKKNKREKRKREGGRREGGREREREGEREREREREGRERGWGKYKCISTKIKMSPSVITDHYNCSSLYD